jgi:hypothetical protein
MKNDELKGAGNEAEHSRPPPVIHLSENDLRRHASLDDASLHPIESLLHFTMDLVEYLKTDCPELTYNLRDLTSSQAGFAVPEWAHALEESVPLDQVIRAAKLYLALGLAMPD